MYTKMFAEIKEMYFTYVYKYINNINVLHIFCKTKK